MINLLIGFPLHRQGLKLIEFKVRFPKIIIKHETRNNNPSSYGYSSSYQHLSTRRVESYGCAEAVCICWKKESRERWCCREREKKKEKKVESGGDAEREKKKKKKESRERW